jgi:phospholipid/cholesterol/gamma-HCH transport system substrate-binding protein
VKILTPETKVGFVVLAGMIILFYLTFRITGMTFFKERDGNRITVFFDNIAGVQERSPVKMAGVPIGKISEIFLENNRARVNIFLEPGVRIPDDSTATVRSEGLLGEKYVEIVPGTPGRPPLGDGDILARSEKPAGIDDLITNLSAGMDDIRAVTKSFKNVFGTEEGEERMHAILGNLESATESMDMLLAGNQARLENIIVNLDTALESLSVILTENQNSFKITMDNFVKITNPLADNAPEIVDNLRAVTANLRGMLDENRDNLREGITNVSTMAGNMNTVVTENREDLRVTMQNVRVATENMASMSDNLNQVALRINEGQGTIGKLVTDDEVYENLNETLIGAKSYVGKVDTFKTSLGARSEFQFDEDDSKSFFTVKLQPREDKYYLLEVSEDVRRRDRDKNRSSIGKILITAMIGKRFGDIGLRGGIQESSAGGGVDFYLWRDRLIFSADIFNLNGYDSKAPDPEIKLMAKYRFQKYLYLYTGVDELINQQVRTYIAGAGILFDEDDIKTVIGAF